MAQNMNSKYTDMTSAVRHNTAVQEEAARTAKQQLHATYAGNIIMAAGFASAHRDAQKTQRLQQENINKLDQQMRQSERHHSETLSAIQDIHSELTQFRVQNHEDMTHMKNITYAQWRDGVGSKYYYEYRPKALEHIQKHQDVSTIWQTVVANRADEIIRQFPSWKKPEWNNDALISGIFLPAPQYPPNPEITLNSSYKEVPEKYSITKLISVALAALFGVGFLAVLADIFPNLLGGLFSLLLVLLIFMAPIAAPLYLRSKRNAEIKEAVKNNEYHSLNLSSAMTVQAEWENTVEGINRKYIADNSRAAMEASELFSKMMGVPLDERLAAYWASDSTNAEIKALQNIVQNEFTNPPAYDQLIEITPFSIRQSLPVNLRNAFESKLRTS